MNQRHVRGIFQNSENSLSSIVEQFINGTVLLKKNTNADTAVLLYGELNEALITAWFEVFQLDEIRLKTLSIIQAHR